MQHIEFNTSLADTLEVSPELRGQMLGPSGIAVVDRFRFIVFHPTPKTLSIRTPNPFTSLPKTTTAPAKSATPESVASAYNIRDLNPTNS